MVALPKARVSAEQFEQFISEHADKDFELIGGEIIEAVSNSYASLVAARILMRIGLFVEDNQLGYVTGADGGYIVGDER